MWTIAAERASCGINVAHGMATSLALEFQNFKDQTIVTLKEGKFYLVMVRQQIELLINITLTYLSFSLGKLNLIITTPGLD